MYQGQIRQYVRLSQTNQATHIATNKARQREQDNHNQEHGLSSDSFDQVTYPGDGLTKPSGNSCDNGLDSISQSNSSLKYSPFLKSNNWRATMDAVHRFERQSAG